MKAALGAKLRILLKAYALECGNIVGDYLYGNIECVLVSSSSGKQSAWPFRLRKQQARYEERSVSDFCLFLQAVEERQQSVCETRQLKAKS